MGPIDYTLYLVTDRDLSLGRSLEEVVRQAIEGGTTVVQLREKNCTTQEFYELGIRMKELLKSYNVPLIINDRLDIALACDADGLHIGQKDMPYQMARRLLGKDKIIGLSVESLEDTEATNLIDVDYIAVSPVFDTNTKTDTSTALGLEGVKKIKEHSVHPVVAIGGINWNNASQIIKAGADGICVVSAIMSAPDPKKAACELQTLIQQSRF